MLGEGMRLKHKGFTLVEMMVALTIFLAMVAFSIPSLRGMWQNNQLRSSADSVLSGVQLAKSEAMKRNIRVYFFLTSSLTSACALAADAKFWVVSMADPSGKCETAPSATINPRIIQIGRLADVTGNVSLTATDSVGDAAYAVGFNGSGFVAPNADSSESVVDFAFDVPKLGADAHKLRVQVADAGRVKMCSVGAVTGDAKACD
jgi:type IV fimbrial biogenesis protein FimT